MRRYSAIRNAAAPSTGGEMIAPSPPAASRRAAGRVGAPAHGAEGEVDEELAGARVLQHGAEDGEQDDQARGDVDRRAEDALELHVEMADQAVHLVAGMRPRRRQMVAEQRVEQE